MADRTPFPPFPPVIGLADPLWNTIRLGLNLWAQSLEQRWDLCRKLVDTVSSAFAPSGETQNELWEANRDLLRFVEDRPFDLERGILAICQTVAGEAEQSQTSHLGQNRSEPRDPPPSSGRRPRSGRPNGATTRPEAERAPLTPGVPAPEPRPLHIQTPIGLDDPVVVPISLRNHNTRPSRIRLSATPYVDERGWLASAPVMRFQPSDIGLPAAGCGEAAGLIDTRSGFEPNRVYRADIILEGDPNMRIPFYIRTLPSPRREAPGVSAELLGPAGLTPPQSG